jgi:Spy/CpxP family protein refolding chaperone
MTKVKVIVVVGFLIAFGAGAVVGLSVRQPAAANSAIAPSTRPSGSSWLRDQLGLSQPQQEEMKKIWDHVATMNTRDHEDRRQQFRKERDDAVAALLSAGEKSAYEKIQQDYSNKLRALGQERSRAYEAAVEKTKAVLTPKQREKYEEMLKRREADSRGRGPGRRSDEHPETRPTTIDGTGRR